MAEELTVDMVVHRLGVTSRTLHYYEEVGLLPNVGRTSGGHRVYDAETVHRLEQILELKETLGYSLKEIRRILQVEEALDDLREKFHRGNLEKSGQLEVLEKYMELLGELVTHINERMEKLETVKQSFEDRLERTRRLYEDVKQT